MNIPIAKCDFTAEDIDHLIQPVKSGWIVQGPNVKSFEEKWCEFTGAKHSIATTSCTTALHLSLFALSVGPGDEVILPAFTWIATANVIEMLGATPVFCDINLTTLNIDEQQINQHITNQTKAIIPVHLFGLPAAMDAINNIAATQNLHIVEDAACGFAAKYNGTHVGNFGKTGCFSFHPRKSITTGEGGMVTTNDAQLNDKMRALRDHGATTSDFARHSSDAPFTLPSFPYAGFNYRMTDLQAALGVSQMNRAEAIYHARAQWAEQYDQVLSAIEWLQPPYRNPDIQHGFQSYVCLFRTEDITMANIADINQQRNAFMKYLFERGISTRPGTHAVHTLDYYANTYNLQPEDCPNSYIADQCTIALPLYPSMTGEEFNHIKQSILSYPI